MPRARRQALSPSRATPTRSVPEAVRATAATTDPPKVTVMKADGAAGTRRAGGGGANRGDHRRSTCELQYVFHNSHATLQAFRPPGRASREQRLRHRQARDLVVEVRLWVVRPVPVVDEAVLDP